jgi:hypothetical protein
LRFKTAQSSFFPIFFFWSHSSVLLYYHETVYYLSCTCKQIKHPSYAVIFHFYLSNWGGTWPSGQRGALASRRSQAQIPAVAVNQLSVLICCLLQEVVVRERSFSLPVCRVTRVIPKTVYYNSKLFGNTLCSQRLEPPRRAG